MDRAPRLPWRTVFQHLSDNWKPGQHLSVIAPTDYGKTYLYVKGLRPLWDYTLTFDIKGDGDPVLKRAGRKLKSYPSRADLLLDEHHHYVISPGYNSGAGRTFGEAMLAAWREGSRRRGIKWLIYCDELRLAAGDGTIANPGLGLGPALTKTWVAGRSRGITLVASNQAARKVPQEFYDQPKWHFFGHPRDDRVLYRISEMGTGDKDLMRAVIPTLDEGAHEFLVTGPGGFSARTVVE